MTKFIIREMRHVVSERVVEAPDEETALAKFWDGHGVRTDADGETIGSDLQSYGEVDE